MHDYMELTEASEGADDGAAILVEHGGRVLRGDGDRGNTGRGIYTIERPRGPRRE